MQGPLIGEVLIPYEPFGGLGCSTAVEFLGRKRSRNFVISDIMQFAFGQTSEDWDNKKVSSHMQACVKKLLSTYNNESLSREVRHNAGLALKHLSQGYPLQTFYQSFIFPRASEKPRAVEYRQRVNELLVDDTIRSDDYTPLVRGKGNFLVHPLIAWLLNHNGCHLDESRLNIYYSCTRRLLPQRLSQDELLLVGRHWWDEFVVNDIAGTLDFVRNWFLTKGSKGDFKSAFAKAATARRLPMLDCIFEEYMVQDSGEKSTQRFSVHDDAPELLK